MRSVRACQWLTGGGFGVVGCDLAGEFVAHRAADGGLRRFEGLAAADRACLGRAPFGWSRDLVSFASVLGGQAGRRCLGADSASNTVRFVSNWDFARVRGVSRRPVVRGKSRARV